jgi:hypothetical protein
MRQREGRCERDERGGEMQEHRTEWRRLEGKRGHEMLE